MGGFTFFLSYARQDRNEDQDEVIVNFERDLVEEVRVRTGLPSSEICFFDGKDIEPGTLWEPRLASAISTSRAFVAMISPTYFGRPYCGKEWEVFRRRIAGYRGALPPGEARAPLMQPVVAPLPRSFKVPQRAKEIQLWFDGYPPEYQELGLRGMVVLAENNKPYRKFVAALAERIIAASNDYPLPDLKGLEELGNIPSAFEAQPAAGVAPGPDPVPSGPRTVRFIFLAARQNELRQVRQELTNYGEIDGREWRPYLPRVDDDIGQLTYAAIFDYNRASPDKLFPELIPTTAATVEAILDAERNHNVVVLVVDAWTLKLDTYRNFIEQFDGRFFFNCGALVPWNWADSETAAALAELTETIQSFYRRLVADDPHVIAGGIDSPERLQAELVALVLKLQSNILGRARVPKLPRAEPTQSYRKPGIDVPSGNTG